MKKILVVGAGGFIGGFIAREALRRGYDTTVAVRESTSRRYLDDERLKFAILDYEDRSQIREVLTKVADGTKWDYIIYNLGATKCANFRDFNRINFEYLRTFTEALKDGDLTPEKFLYVSSLSALGPGDERNYTPMDNKMAPHPNTRYGLSKIKAETYLETHPEIPWVIFRPTGVYGPHERDYLMMIKSIDKGVDFGVGFRRQMLTFIYVEDLVEAMFQALEAKVTTHKKYIISEDRAYSQKEFRDMVVKLLNKRVCVPIKLPLWLTYIASFIAEKYGVATLKPSTLNRDKYKIMKQRNWNCDIEDARRDFGFSPKFSLERGLGETVKAYLMEKEGRR